MKSKRHIVREMWGYELQDVKYYIQYKIKIDVRSRVTRQSLIGGIINLLTDMINQKTY
jgi:hypothetical protein